ncbi:MAG: hypothetical protein IKK93_01075 [Campylobacter sp.]|nr:hypothetical protein [Campylobacter sp.]
MMDYWFGTPEKTEPLLTEVCDICGRDCVAPIPRYNYVSPKGTTFVIRHHPQCNPLFLVERLKLC